MVEEIINGPPLAPITMRSVPSGETKTVGDIDDSGTYTITYMTRALGTYELVVRILAGSEFLDATGSPFSVTLVPGDLDLISGCPDPSRNLSRMIPSSKGRKMLPRFRSNWI